MRKVKVSKGRRRSVQVPVKSFVVTVLRLVRGLPVAVSTSPVLSRGAARRTSLGQEGRRAFTKGVVALRMRATLVVIISKVAERATSGALCRAPALEGVCRSVPKRRATVYGRR